MPVFAKREYTLELTTPAFLGGADQSAEWRTPGIKALIRQWWRVAYVAEHGLNVELMRRAEGELFGTVNDNSGVARQARLRIRLGEWKAGSLQQMPAGKTVNHPEVGNGGKQVNAFLYLGYGPLASAGQGVRLTKEKALATMQNNTLSLIGQGLNENAWLLIDRAMHMVACLGAIGGRSRNGWGSLLVRICNQPQTVTLEDLSSLPCRPLSDCLAHDWPTALGSTNNLPLIWKGKKHPNWEAAMHELAKIKIDFRTHLGFTTGNNAQTPEDRHYLAYPVTNHKVLPWGDKKRLPNSLRFKVFKTAQGEFVPLAFHLPHQLPPMFKPRPSTDSLLNVWQRVHAHLDETMIRIQAP